MIIIESLLVERVPHLVHHGEESAREIAGPVPERNSNIARSDHRAERMRPQVEAAFLCIEPDLLRNAFRERALLVDREVGFVFARLALILQCGDERNEILSQFRKQSRELAARHSWFVVVEKRVVSFSRPPDGVGFLSRERKSLLEPRSEAGKIVVLSRAHPGLRRHGRNSGELLDELSRQPRLAVVVAPQLADVDCVSALCVCGQR